MERTFAAFSYTCPSCGWVGYKTEKYEGLYCTKCGCKDEPLVELTTHSVTVVDELQKEIEKAAKFCKAVAEDADPNKVIEDVIEKVDINKITDLFRFGGVPSFYMCLLNPVYTHTNY